MNQSGERCIWRQLRGFQITKIFPNNRVLPPNKSYDEISKMVNEKFKENESLTPRDIDKELNLPSGTSFEMSGWSDYFEYIYEDGDD